MSDGDWITSILERQASKAEAKGFVVDRHCWPWVAYKGPRFAPTEWFHIPS